METYLFGFFAVCFFLKTFSISTSDSPKVQMLQLGPESRSVLWVLGLHWSNPGCPWLRMRARNQTRSLSLEGLSADVTDFQGLEMTFRSCTAGPQVNDSRNTAPHPSELNTCKTFAHVELRPISKNVLQRDRIRLHRNFYLCQQFVLGWNPMRWRDAALFDEWRTVG